MIAHAIQPSVRRPVEPFGGRNFFDSSADRRLLILQAAPIAIGPEYLARIGASFGTRATLADSARDWVRIVLKARPKPKSPITRSILDLPPLDLGEVLHPISEDAELLSEMLDDTRF